MAATLGRVVSRLNRAIATNLRSRTRAPAFLRNDCAHLSQMARHTALAAA
jgi:hypothetical protein